MKILRTYIHLLYDSFLACFYRSFLHISVHWRKIFIISLLVNDTSPERTIFGHDIERSWCFFTRALHRWVLFFILSFCFCDKYVVGVEFSTKRVLISLNGMTSGPILSRLSNLPSSRMIKHCILSMMFLPREGRASILFSNDATDATNSLENRITHHMYTTHLHSLWSDVSRLHWIGCSLAKFDDLYC